MSNEEHLRPKRRYLPSQNGPDWVIEDIKVGNAVVPPPTEEDRRRVAEAARAHEAVVVRTLMDGPGNRSRIVGCACRAEGVHDAATWAAHVGVPGGERFLVAGLALEDMLCDAIDYPTKTANGHALIERVRQLAAEVEIYGRVYGTAASLRTYPVPFDDHLRLVDAVDTARQELHDLSATSEDTE